MSVEKRLHSKSYSSVKTKKCRWLWILLLLTLFLALSTFWMIDKSQTNLQSLYMAAVNDARIAEAEEIEPLVELTASSPMSTWDDQGRVLLLSWHRHPDWYPTGEEIKLTNGLVWTFTDKEIFAWYEENKDDVMDWNLRLEQLIGLPPDAGYTHISGFLAKQEDVLRPAYVSDITKQMQNTFPDDIDDDFKEWFKENSMYSYEESAYPWTRLGYTYDWVDHGMEYGLTEFLIKENAPVKVAFTKTTTEFINWLEQGASLDAITLNKRE